MFPLHCFALLCFSSIPPVTILSLSAQDAMLFICLFRSQKRNCTRTLSFPFGPLSEEVWLLHCWLDHEMRQLEMTNLLILSDEH